MIKENKRKIVSLPRALLRDRERDVTGICHDAKNHVGPGFSRASPCWRRQLKSNRAGDMFFDRKRDVVRLTLNEKEGTRRRAPKKEEK